MALNQKYFTLLFFCLLLQSSFCEQLNQGIHDNRIYSTKQTRNVQDNIAKIDDKAKCEFFAGTQCKGVVFYNVYRNETFDQSKMSTEVSSLLSLSTLPGVTAACTAAATSLSCGQFFQSCQEISGQSVVVSIPPCRSLCENVNKECYNILSQFNKLLDCGAIDSRTGASMYPEESITYRMPDDSLQNFQCNNMVPVGYFPNLLSNGGFQESTTKSGEIVPGWRVIAGISASTTNATIMADRDITNDTTNVMLLSQFANSTTEYGFSGIYQTVAMNRTEILDIRISGSSKAMNVSGGIPYFYGISVDFVYDDESSEIVSLNFTEGSHDYEQQSIEITPQRPVNRFTYSVQLWNTSGSASFDNLALQEKVPEVSNAPLECLKPYLVETPEGECAIGCPLPVFDGQTGEPIYILQSFFGWLSFILSSFLIATWLIFPKRRVYPTRLVLNFGVSCWIISFRFVIISFYGFKDSLCKNGYTYIDYHNHFCNFTGFLQTFGGLSALLWWWVMVFNTWLMITTHIKKPAWLPTLERYYHAIVWLWSLFAALLGMFGAKHMSGVVSIGGCWITAGENSAWMLGIFYGPLGVGMLTGTFFIGHCVYIIYNISNRTTRTGARHNFSHYTRLLGFVAIILAPFVALFLYKFYYIKREKELYDQFEEYVICKNSGREDCGTAPSVSMGFTMVNQLAITCFGSIVFVFFCSQREIFIGWKELILNRQIVSGTTHKTTRGASNKSAASGVEMHSAVELPGDEESKQ